MTNPFCRKHLLMMALTLGVAAGCATTPPEPTVAPQAQTATAASQMIADAKAGIAEAKALNWIWRDTEKFLADAEKAAADGDHDTALKLATKARNEAQLAINQYYLEKAKVMMSKAEGTAGLNAEQNATMRAASAAIANAEGRKAYDLLTGLMAELRGSMMQYTVVQGDSLWKISGRSDVYNNPYQWPLIYKANRDKIRDADLIHPGQRFDVDQNPSAAEVNAAVNHARTRGAWAIGVVEESDRAYLGSVTLR
jgi:nucleoid-associated protein YgaU